jgi:protein-S-isoprenylcysteine O-methyltransferase Ste14
MKTVFFYLSAPLVMCLGLGVFLQPNIVQMYPFMVVFMATLIGYISQPSVTKSELFNPSDGYSMFGILMMLLTVTNLSVIEFSLCSSLNYSLDVFNIIGFLLISAGLAIRIYAINILGIFFSNDVKIKVEHQLFDRDIYAYIRHPTYLGAILSIVGTSFWLESWQTFPIVLIITATAYYYRITQEEEILLRYFGNKYALYRQKTGCLFPKLFLILEFFKKFFKKNE